MGWILYIYLLTYLGIPRPSALLLWKALEFRDISSKKKHWKPICILLHIHSPTWRL